MHKENNKAPSTERGNVFMIILIAVVLFGALGFTMSRGFRSDTTSTMSARQAELAASDILAYAQKIERAVNRLRRNGCSESELSFENDIASGYDFSTRDECKLFESTGGKLTWTSPAEGVNDGSEWHFSGNIQIESLGTTNSLTILLHSIDLEVCKKINKKAGLNEIPQQDTLPSGLESIKFTGSFSIPPIGALGNTSNQYEGQPYGCFKGYGNAYEAGTYHFYYTLLIR